MLKGSGDLLVCGGSGFLGAHLVSHLVREKGPWDRVKALARSEASAEKLRALGAEPVLGDLLGEAERLRYVVAEAAYVVYCAQPPVDSQHAASRLTMEQNFLSALAGAKVKRAVMVFGSSYYGCTARGELADEAMSPRHPIGLGKLFEPSVEALQAMGAKGLDYVAAFPGAIYGRGTWFLELYLASIQSGAPIFLRDPPPVWPYIHVEDCARALAFLLTVAASRLEEVGREIILCSDELASVSAFIEHVSLAVGKRAELLLLPPDVLREKLPRLLSDYLTSDMAHSNARLKRLGFELKYRGLAEGMKALQLAQTSPSPALPTP